MMTVLTKKRLKAGFTVFDVADYLTTPKRIAAYLDATIEEANGDQAFIMNALNTVARAQKRNMSQLAKDTGITRSGLYEVLSATGNPSFATVQKLAAALGMRLSFKPAP